VSPKHDAVESIRLPTAILGFPVKGFPNAIPLDAELGSVDRMDMTEYPAGHLRGVALITKTIGAEHSDLA